ncbi:hypothetical protein K432DRAFT_65040 [Lepidopterella palustris CBS 459.81]|uniref:Uncharacterized protein n=1 Tax=Lepidopterella palustris CBS 459.81 TaxID=1314670 RepID=A0A8E2JEY0_9PEZI|nr:hypothetical protein K432DRAFT_65040 [Lepidopterella palustris CBS 459.81]
MRFSNIFLSALASIVLLAKAAPVTDSNSIPHVFVVNHCPYDVYVSSVDSVAGPVESVPAGDYWYEDMHYDPAAGVAIKVATEKDGLFNGSPVFIFAYSISPAEKLVWYSLSNIVGDPFSGYRVILHSRKAGACPTLQWPTDNGITRNCADTDDLILSLCV